MSLDNLSSPMTLGIHRKVNKLLSSLMEETGDFLKRLDKVDRKVNNLGVYCD